MKKLLIDQTLFLAIGIAIMIIIPSFCGPFFTFFFEIVVMLCWGYLCRRILLLPIDLILGKVTQTVYFASQCNVEDLDLIKGVNYYVWKFSFGKNQMLRLLVPIAITKGKACRIDLPPKEVKLRITYFRLSKILLQWNLS